VKERAYVREAVQHAARLGLRPIGVHHHASRGDVDARARRRDHGGGRGATVSATAANSHVCMPTSVHEPMAVWKRGMPCYAGHPVPHHGGRQVQHTGKKRRTRIHPAARVI